MEVAYFKILDPTNRRESLNLVSGFMKFFGGNKAWDKVVTAEADEKTSRLFVFEELSNIERAKNYLIDKGCLLEFDIKTKDYILMKNLDPSMYEDENSLILSNFLKENMTLDDVLDKIKISGVDSLNKIDLKILENKKP